MISDKGMALRGKGGGGRVDKINAKNSQIICIITSLKAVPRS